MDFANLHVHSEFSLLDGAGRIKDIVQRAVNLKQDTIALTDHGVLYGAVDFYKEAKSAGVKPIIGMEAYVAARKHTDRHNLLDRKSYHLLMLAINDQGYDNIRKMSSIAFVDGFYYRPRIDKDILLEHSDGIIVTSTCLAGEIPSLYMRGNESAAMDLIDWYKDVFGERFFLEVQPHAFEEQQELNAWIMEQGKRTGIPIVGTMDAHYVNPEDAEIHDTLLCIQTGARKNQTNRMSFTGETYYVASGDDMTRYFGTDEYTKNTLKVSEMIGDVHIEFGKYHLPEYHPPEGYNVDNYLRHLCEVGMRWRFPNGYDDTYKNRLDYELGIIDEMGFNTYFLIVWDICSFAYRRGIWWNVRGSGAGSLVAYALGITSLDPIEQDLIFERFLNPSRVSMPDIDIDFPDNRRSELVDYVALRYGQERVAAITTFGTMGAKGAMRDVSRVLDVPLPIVDAVSKVMDGKDDLETQYDENLEFREMIDNNPQLRQVYESAVKLEGMSRHDSTHAAGIIVADKDLREYVPLQRIKGKSYKDTRLNAATQFDMNLCEKLGLLKIDFLGLSTLTIMRKAADFIKERHGVEWTIDNIPFKHNGDPRNDELVDTAMELIASGNVAGVFQIEGTGMSAMLKMMRPYKYEHVVAAIALYRPGPMENIPSYVRRMHGEEPVEYLHEKLEPILKDTYGIIIYQETLMRIASELFGYTPGEADLIRKAVGKKLHDELMKHKQNFINRGPENGIDSETSEAIWHQYEAFARYGFNLSHASDYAKITVQTAVLKALHPTEYMASLLEVYQGKSDRIEGFFDEARRTGIKILPPNVNKSKPDFSIEDHMVIRTGLTAVKGVGIVPASILAENQPYESLGDLIDSANLTKVNKTAMANLARVGAFDDFGDRDDFMTVAEKLRKSSKAVWRTDNKKTAQMTMFQKEDFDKTVVTLGEILEQCEPHELTPSSQADRVEWERELIGINFTPRTVENHADYFIDHHCMYIKDILNDEFGVASFGNNVTIGGEITRVTRITTKKGDPMGFVDLECFSSGGEKISLVFFPDTWKNYHWLCNQGEIVIVHGKADNSRESTQVIVEKISRVSDLDE